jgi:hypothetical protein
MPMLGRRDRYVVDVLTVKNAPVVSKAIGCAYNVGAYLGALFPAIGHRDWCKII